MIRIIIILDQEKNRIYKFSFECSVHFSSVQFLVCFSCCCFVKIIFLNQFDQFHFIECIFFIFSSPVISGWPWNISLSIGHYHRINKRTANKKYILFFVKNFPFICHVRGNSYSGCCWQPSNFYFISRENSWWNY